ncbi:MAG: 3-hydroxy-9,10-secoandrosta,3,5(10)-triene-9,17-dione monooxygenase [Pseudonocardiales bacterium]|nr:3-hydroxy-9,10-secoandrosta,3,5(10)-triene-9,17-dione monooxygenase [Pseudonocardiales bacterium]
MTELAERPTAAPTGAELIQRAADLVPMLRANAPQAHAERRMPKENLKALEDSGILRATRAREYGGYEIDTHTKLGIFRELARGCGSTAWVATLYSDADFLIAHFPDEVQEQVYGDGDPSVHCTATLIPTARAERDGAGFRLNGKWPFNSGCLDGTWVTEPAVVELEAGRPEVCLFLMPYADLTILDDWHVSGLRGTGSNSVVGENVFVPEERMLRLEELKLGQGRSERNKDRPIYTIPAVPYVLTSGGGTFPGLASAVLELFMERLPTRGPIAYTGYGQRSEAPITHHHVAEASMKIRSGDHLMSGAADILSRHAQSGEPYAPGEIPEIWGMVSYSTRLYGEAIETLRQASGASGIHESQPIQLVSRDAQALATHAVMMPTTGIEIYGRSLCGLEPNTPML